MSTTDGPAENLWTAALRRDPEHAHRYAERWRRLEASGQDIHGEARLLDAMAARGARILDAGCGSGRLGGHLARAGHDVTGVDLDPHLIDVAQADHPGARWEVGEPRRPRPAGGGRHPLPLRPAALRGQRARLPRRCGAPAGARPPRRAPRGGRQARGRFGLDRGSRADDFAADAAAAGLRLEQRFSTWDLRPADDRFLVGILGRA